MPRQPTAQHVECLAAAHRDSIEVLKKIGECCLKEASSWTANVTAIMKAKTDEEKAAAREVKKEEKRAAAAEKRANEKAAKEAKKIADAAAGANAVDAVECDDDASKKKTRNRNRGGQAELSESDPALFHAMFKFVQWLFLQRLWISQHPSLKCLMRLLWPGCDVDTSKRLCL